MKSRALYLYLALALVACSCSVGSTSGTSGGDTTKGSITIAFSGGARTLVPDYAGSITSYSVSLTSEDGYATQTATASPDAGSVSFTEVHAGTWDIAVVALSGETEIGRGSFNGFYFGSGDSAGLSILVSMTQASSGGFRFAFAFPSSTGIDYVSGQLIGDAGAVGEAQEAALVDGGETVSGSIAESEIPSGHYRLALTFRRGGAEGIVAARYGEAVNVWDKVVSDKLLDSSGALLAYRAFVAGDFNSSEAKLASLVLEADGAPLDLGFVSGTSSYTVASNAGICLIPTQSMEGQGIRYRVDGGSWIDIASGASSDQIGFADARRTISVEVTATDRTTTSVYTVVVETQAKVLVSPATLTLYIGKSESLSAAVTASSADSGEADQALTWASGDESLATVDSSGKVTAIGTGLAAGEEATVAITAKSGAYSYYNNGSVEAVRGSCVLTVRNPSPAAMTIGVKLGTYETLSFTPSSVTIALGEAIEVTPSFSSAGSDWVWYVNGVKVGSESSLSYSPTSPGFYRIVATAVCDGVMYSGSLNATVTR